MRRHWRNKAASTAAAIMIAASMFSGSLTTAWAEGEVAETTSEEMPTYEASDDSAAEEEAAVEEEEDGDSTVYEWIYGVILECIAFIEQEKYREATDRYTAMVLTLKGKYLVNESVCR